MKEAEGNLADNSLVTAAHELKTPLVLIRQLSIQLARETESSQNAKIAQRMKLTADRSLRLVDNLTKAARLDGAMFELEPIVLSGICDEVIDEMFPLAHELGQKLECDFGQKPVVAVANRELIRSMLLGLIDNALHYNKAAQSIQISTRISRKEALISVRDNGERIDISEFRKLKESVGRQAQPISSRPLSSGLGLMIAATFLNAMDGTLSLERHRAGGITFTVHLPISRQLSLFEV